MLRSKVILLLGITAIGFIACSGSSQAKVPTVPPVPTLETASAEQYLTTAFDFTQKNYVFKSQVNWPALRAEVFTVAARDHARTPADTYPAIRNMLSFLPSHHSFFATPTEAATHSNGQTSASLGFLSVFSDTAKLPVIVALFPGGPAQLVGVQVGDTIATVNGQPAGPFPNRYPADSTLQLLRNGHAGFITVQLHASTVDSDILPTGFRLSANIRYLALAGSTTAHQDEIHLYTDRAQGLIQTIDSTATCGWIVDLRIDFGGGDPPMMAGVGPILGDGQSGAFVAPDQANQPWSYQNGQFVVAGSVRESATHPYVLKHPNPPVAVLTDQVTASAGEVVLIAFRGRPNSRTFGLPSAGYPTANGGMDMSDGARIVLTTAQEADRTGHVYPEAPIAPDQTVTPDWTRFGTAGDPVIVAAQQWLQSQAACQGK